MHRLLLASLLGLAAVTPPAASAALVGGPADGPLRLLRDDLTPRAGGPALPAGTTATARSPDGRRIAALTPEHVVVFARASGRRLYRVRARGATDVLWPAARRLVTLGDGVLRSVAMPAGRVLRRVRLPERVGHELAGRGVRVLVRTGTGFRVDVFGAGGRRVARHRIPVSDPGLARASLRDGLVVLSTTTGAVAPYEHALVRPGEPSRPLSLAGSAYAFVTPSILADAAGHVARIDAGRVVREIEVDAGQWPAPFRGGIAVGLGRAVYDGELELVAAHRDAPRGASAPVAAGRRLYALTLRCTDRRPVHAAVGVDGFTGELVTRRRGPFVIGRLGERLSAPAEDGCD